MGTPWRSWGSWRMPSRAAPQPFLALAKPPRGQLYNYFRYYRNVLSLSLPDPESRLTHAFPVPSESERESEFVYICNYINCFESSGIPTQFVAYISRHKPTQKDTNTREPSCSHEYKKRGRKCGGGRGKDVVCFRHEFNQSNHANP